MSSKQISTASPRARSNPLHFIEAPIYTQVSHRLWKLSRLQISPEKPVEKRSLSQQTHGFFSGSLLQMISDPLRVRFRRMISGEVADVIALAAHFTLPWHKLQPVL